MTLQSETEIQLYRFELYCEGEDQEVGFLVGIEDIGLSIEKEERLLRPFDENLVDPWHPNMCRSVSFFTEKGMRTFSDAIRDLVLAYEGSIFDVKLISIKLPSHMLNEVIYQDDFQVCIPKELYKGELAAAKEVSKPCFEKDFPPINTAKVVVKNISKEKSQSLEKKIQDVVEQQKGFPAKKCSNKGQLVKERNVERGVLL